MAETRGPAARLDPAAGPPRQGRVVALYTCERGGDPMSERSSLRALAGVGVEGDRYANGRGYWSFEKRFVDQITFVEAEAIERVATALGRPFEPRDSRRNVVTGGIALEALIGRQFSIGDAVFAGLRPCDPCAYLDTLLGLPVRALLAGRGGLRASILRGGTIDVGARIEPGPRSDPPH